MVPTGWVSSAAKGVRRERRGLVATALMVVGVVAVIGAPSIVHAQLRQSAAQLVAHTMGNPEFRPKSFRGGTWLGNGDA